MSNNKDFKVKNGIQPTAYYEAVGTVVSGSEAYSVAGGSYDNVSFSVASEEASPSDISFKSDGTKMYVIGASGDDINQYTLSTAWDISTASFDSVTFSVASQEVTPNALFIKPDGTTFWVAGNANDTVYQYSMSTAWDMSTASYDSVSFSVVTEGTYPVGIWFKTDGTEMYIADLAGGEVNQYTLSTAWDITTASFTTNLSVSSEDTATNSLVFNSSGTSMFVSGVINDAVFEYILTTAWDLSTASYSGNSLNVSSQTDYPSGIYFKSDGSKLYVLNYGTGDIIYQYSTVITTAELDLSTGSVFEIAPTSDIQISLSNPADSGTVSSATLLLDGGVASAYDIAGASYDSVSFSVSGQETLPYGLTFKPDGTKMYVVGGSGDDINQYTLSTAFDLSSASFDSVTFSVASQDSAPRKVKFNDDGTKMFIVGTSTDTVYQYSLSTAYDISTASYDSVSFSVSSQDTDPRGLDFKPDGTKMYILGTSSDDVFQYSLSTAWDLSTASYDSVSFDTTAQDNDPFSITFNNDGTLFFIVTNANDSVYQYSCSTAYDISTASYDSVSFSLASQETNAYDAAFSSNGVKMFIIGASTDAVYQYTTGADTTITWPSSIEWAGGVAPSAPANGETDVFTLSTDDGGTSYVGVKTADNLS